MKTAKISPNTIKINLILLGLLMLIPGLLKLFVMGPGAITGMLSGNPLFSWAPAFWAWVLILVEILAGIAILIRWKLEKVVWLPIIILVVAAFTANWGNWGSLILHLAAASNYWMYTSKH